MKSNTPLEARFFSEVMKWRYIKSLFFSFAYQFVLSTFMCSVINIICFDNMWNPFVWISRLITGIFKPLWIFKIFIPSFCYIVLARIHVHSYEVTWWIPHQRLEYVLGCIKWKRLAQLMALIWSSAFLFHYYVYSVDPSFSNLTTPCQSNGSESCINHKGLFVWFLGVSFGCRFALLYFFGNSRCVRVGGAARPGLMPLLKSKFTFASVAESCRALGVGPKLVFVLLAYVVLGDLVSSWVTAVLPVSSPAETVPLWRTFWSFLDVRFAAAVSLCSVLLAYNLRCFLAIFENVVSENLDIPLVDDNINALSQHDGTLSLTLFNSLNSSSTVLRLLAFRKLKDIATSQALGKYFLRSQIFSISQPGGHARNWQSVVGPCLAAIRDLSSRLCHANSLGVKLAPSSTLAPGDLSAAPTTDLNRNDIAKSPPPTPKSKLTLLKEKIGQFPIIGYLISELPDSANRRIFADAQTVIWAVEAISYLVAASYSEDRYGVVQKHASEILTALVQLQQVIEKVGRGISHRRGLQTNAAETAPLDARLRRSLRLTLRSSLYVICDTFGDTIREIPVTDEISSKLNMYLIFQEG